jgi:site-specific DNA-methyltransferase (adenine-specific)
MNTLTTYNPDVLLCLANLSNDEVFTPPTVAADMLNTLPDSLWSDPNATFLDPVTKSGVFLREIAKRLTAGLEDKIPDLQERINHIYTKQIYGIAITELTGLLSRRSLYCSRFANGKYSIVTSFNTLNGNIEFGRIEHKWFNNHCVFCGANQSEYDRSEELETHAYKLIHTNNPEELYDMKFDVIIGNPPYQLNDGGGSGTSAMPIYQKFVEQSIKLQPRYLTMIIPARWYSGGKGLDDFRDQMLHDKRLRNIVDYPEAIDAFSGVQIKGGVMYFLWNRDHPGKVKVSTFKKDRIVSELERELLEDNASTFIRYNEAIPILKKILSHKESSLIDQVSSRKPFGIESNIYGTKKKTYSDVALYHKNGLGYFPRLSVKSGRALIGSRKVLMPKAGSGSDSFPHQILGKPIITMPNSVCTETYIVLGAYDNDIACKNLALYATTKLFRFLVLLKKTTQNAARNVYEFVPVQDFTQEWTDEKLYKKYGLTQEEIDFIESMIRPMELS